MLEMFVRGFYRTFKKRKKYKRLKENQILVASEISPADLLSYTKTKISGLVSVLGGPEGHFAIVARSLSIPTIVGVKNFLKKVKENEKIILDGEKGLIIKNPTIQTEKFYKKKLKIKKVKIKN